MTIPLTFAGEQDSSNSLVAIGDWLVWAVFLIEFALMISISPDRWSYVRLNWLNLIIIVISFPLLPGLLALVRLVRLIRLVRLVIVLWIGLRSLRHVLGRRGLMYVGVTSGFIIMTGSLLLYFLEPETVHGDVAEAIWRAVTTVTTVGYGDVMPVTLWGRLVAVVVMVTGIALFSTLAAAIAAYFVGQDENAKRDHLSERLGRIEALLSKRVETSVTKEDVP